MIISKRDALKLSKNHHPVCFTNGCFDLIVPQHVRLLKRCAQYGLSIVSVNDDKTVRALKGADRPIVGEQDRLEIVDSIKWVDWCFLNDDASPLEAIMAIRPDFLVKGDEYHEADIIGAAEVRSWGGQVIRFPGSLESLHSQDIIVRCRTTQKLLPEVPY